MFSSTRRVTYYVPDSKVGVTLLVGILFLLFSLLMIRATSETPGFSPLYLLALLQISPFLLSAVRQEYDYISFILFNHFFSYSIAKFNQLTTVFRAKEIPPESVVAMKELTFCTLLILGAYYAVRMLFGQSHMKEKFQLLSLTPWQLIIVSGYVVLMPMFLHQLPSWYTTFHFSVVGADMILLLSSNTPGHEKLSLVLRLAVLVSTVWYFLTTGMLTMVGVLAAYVFIAACIRRRYNLLLIPLILTIIGSLMQNVKADYRKVIYDNPNMPTVERLEVLAFLMVNEYGSDGKRSQVEPDEQEENGEVADKLLYGFQRVGDDSLERVLAWTPSKVPYWGGETYNHIPFMFIPRVLWPDKPSRHIWNKFGRTYGYLSPEDTETSVGLTYLAEGYMNFGFMGMYAVAIFFGIFTWMVEALSYNILRGHFAFTFMIFLIPLQWYAADLGSIMNSVFITLCVLLLFRTQFMKMARKDEYS